MRLWKTVKGSQIALYPNLNVVDPVWRELVRRRSFRRALPDGSEEWLVDVMLQARLAHTGWNQQREKGWCGLSGPAQ